MYETYIDEFMPSEEMRAYLKLQELNQREIAAMIFNSPVPMKAKLRAIQELLAETHIDAYREGCLEYLTDMEAALGLLTAEGVFSIELECVDADNVREEGFQGIFASYENVKEFIQKDMEECKGAWENYHWYEVSKWVEDECGKFYDICRYYFVKGEICFCELDDDYAKTVGGSGEYVNADVNLPVPFRPGDIVMFDGYPFNCKVFTVILEIGDNRDCCCVQALYWDNSKGKWDVGAVKHGHIGVRAFPQVSPLYGARIYDGELPDKLRIFHEISRYISGSEERGGAVWDKVNAMEISDEKLDSVLYELENHDRKADGYYV